jgi:hypothetical protein
LEFLIRAGKANDRVQGSDHEAALTKHLMEQRWALLRVKDLAESEKLFSDLPKKAVVSGGGASKSYRVKWEKVGGRKSRFPGARFVFSVEESRLGRLFSFR